MTANIFENCIIYILPNGILQKRIHLFENKIIQYGGQITQEPSEILPTHIIVEDCFLTKPTQVIEALKALNLLYESLNSKVVGTLWLSRCLKDKQLLDTENFEFKRKVLVKHELENERPESPVKKSRIETKLDTSFNVELTQNDHCFTNKLIINEFQKLADSYRVRRDKWKTLGYEKAIRSIKSFKKEIKDADDVKGLPNISAKMADKIAEILENGYLTKARELYDDEKTKVLDMFGKIWGVGPNTAECWYLQNLRTFEDLEMRGNLTRQQKIGLKYYHDIQEKIPREEVQEIIEIVKNSVASVDPSLKVMPCGSYRRGKQTCGDIDILIIKKDHIKYDSVLPKILHHLKSINFIIDDLIDSENKEVPKKYLGLCRLNDFSKIRRLDIFVVSENESAAAIMHYTGSGLFNRAIRLYASKKNMHLSEHGLYRVDNQDKDMAKKHLILTPDEETIFKYLGLPYRAPENREVFTT